MWEASVISGLRDRQTDSQRGYPPLQHTTPHRKRSIPKARGVVEKREPMDKHFTSILSNHIISLSVPCPNVCVNWSKMRKMFFELLSHSRMILKITIKRYLYLLSPVAPRADKIGCNCHNNMKRLLVIACKTRKMWGPAFKALDQCIPIFLNHTRGLP